MSLQQMTAPAGGGKTMFPGGMRFPSRRSLAVFILSLGLFLVASVHLTSAIGLAGDEPWYVLQGLSIVYYHTVDMSHILGNLALLHHFLYTPGTHVAHFVGHSIVLTYLPGYAAIVGTLYALDGRLLVVGIQSVVAASTALLLFHEALRLWHSQVVALFAVLAYVTAMPTMLYVAEVFPSTLGAFIALASFVLVVRYLPAAKKTSVVGVACLLGLLASLLPWVHIRFASLAVIITGAALCQLFLARASDHHQAAPAEEGQHKRLTLNGWDRYTSVAMVLIAGLPTLSFVLISRYDLRYFGTWYPQYSTQTSSEFIVPDVGHMALIYKQILLSGQDGLIPWMPLVLLVLAGAILLFRHNTNYALLTMLWIAGLLGAFVSSAFAPHVNQAFALPARFSVEAVPFLVICCTQVFFVSLQLLTQRTGGRLKDLLRLKSLTLPICGGLALAGLCVLLLTADTWFTVVGEMGLPLLYPSAKGIRIVVEYHGLLPGWWFSLFAP